MPVVIGEPRPIRHCVDCGRPVAVRNARGVWSWAERCRSDANRRAFALKREVARAFIGEHDGVTVPQVAAWTGWTHKITSGVVLTLYLHGEIKRQKLDSAWVYSRG